MKRLLVVFTLLFVSLNFVACAEKKENKTRLTQGGGRSSGIGGTSSATGWDDLNHTAMETDLRSNNPNLTAREFFNIGIDDAAYDNFDYNSVVMKLVFINGQLNTSKTKMGLRFYDISYDPLTYLVSSAQGGITGYKNGNHVDVKFKDGNGEIRVEGDISGSTFSGDVTYDNGKFLGSFTVPTQYSIFYN